MIYIGAFLLFVAGLVQSVVLPQAVPVQARPQFVVLLVISVCLVESLYDAAFWAFIGGMMLFMLMAFGRCSRGTRLGTSDCRAGPSKEPAAELSAASR